MGCHGTESNFEGKNKRVALLGSGSAPARAISRFQLRSISLESICLSHALEELDKLNSLHAFYGGLHSKINKTPCGGGGGGLISKPYTP